MKPHIKRVRLATHVLALFAAATAVTVGLAKTSAFAAVDKAHADIKSRDGKDLGKIKIVETTAGILIRLRLKGLTPGAHGFHITDKGTCEGDFTTAGTIHNPLGAKHGYLNDQGPMAGDLPNLIVPASGEIELDLISAFVTLNKDSEESLLDNDGAAFVIHEKPDDYKSDPDGNAGARIACGVITAPVK
jgi:superoxide dismutase, Cu-Zn family